ncbi:MAG: SDR family NAD(P)-dependent oxidoreductase [Candidatus Liptonbacteria bacterium]|nr:SDR family NAD(P)-dependent oxidoreductase [Candidatus Liptonbacteria bacterium]
MKIIVTGGAGFIGSHVADAYLAAGHQVVVIDNLATGVRSNVPRRAKFYQADIRETKKIDAIFRRERPQMVNHHAALASVTVSVREPAAIMQTNLVGTVNLLAAFSKYRADKNGKFIFASTGGAMYGSPRHLSADENTPPNPTSPYGLSKLFSEQAVRFFAREHRFEYLIFRYANVYGPRQRTNGEAGIVPIFHDLIRAGQRPKIFGDGTKTRDYVFVGDVVQANVLALGRGKNTILNIGCGREISDLAMFQAIARASNYDRPPLFVPYRAGEVRRIALDARRAKKILGWRPTVKLEQGVPRTIKAG